MSGTASGEGRGDRRAEGGAEQHPGEDCWEWGLSCTVPAHTPFHLLFSLAPSLLHRSFPFSQPFFLLLCIIPSSAPPLLSLSFFLISAGSYLFFLVYSQCAIPFLDPVFPSPLSLFLDSVSCPPSSFWNTWSAWCPGTSAP